MSGRTRVAPGRRRRAAAAAAARLAVGHPPRPGPAAPPTRSWIVQPVRDRATGARSMPDTNMAKFSFVVPCGPPSHTREPTQERRLCAETRHPGSWGRTSSFATIQRTSRRAIGQLARAVCQTLIWQFSFVVPCGSPSHTREPTRKRRLCGDETPGVAWVRNDPTRTPTKPARERQSQRAGVDFVL